MYLPSVSVKNCLLQVIWPLYLEDNDIKWNEQGFPPQIQRAGLTTVYANRVLTLDWLYQKQLHIDPEFEIKLKNYAI